jgi:hypothetical protein
MSKSMIEQFEHMTIADLRKLTEDYEKCQEIIEKQNKTIEMLKIKYPNKKVDEEFDVNNFLEDLDKEKKCK